MLFGGLSLNMKSLPKGLGDQELMLPSNSKLLGERLKYKLRLPSEDHVYKQK